MIALVTTFNEADTIGPLVEELRGYCRTVVVVDDPKSSDGTGRAAAAAGALTVRAVDEGIGPCLLAGLRWCRGDRVVVLDAGGSHNPAAIPHMARVDADVVIGSRFLPGSRYDGRPWRAFASRMYARLCNRRFETTISDWTSGYRIYSEAAVEAILSRPPAARMHCFQPEVLATCLEAGLVVKEYPITYRAGRSSLDNDAAREAITWLVGLRCL